MKRLKRSKSQRMFSGVIGGLAEYMSIDATLLRLIFAVLVVFTGIFPGVILYIVAMFIIPEE